MPTAAIFPFFSTNSQDCTKEVRHGCKVTMPKNVVGHFECKRADIFAYWNALVKYLDMW